MQRNAPVIPPGFQLEGYARSCVRGETMTPRLLVLDDELDLLYLYQLILEPEGYAVHIAASGFEQAMDIEHFQPDLLILDYHMNRRDTEPLLH